jgi:hypothetical protein
MLALSTNTLIGVVGKAASHSEVEAVVAELKSRNDLVNLNPVRLVALDSTRPNGVRQAAVELATDWNAAETIRWYAEQAESLFAPPHVRERAIQALAWCRRPAETLHIIERIATRQGNSEVRITAIRTAASFRNVRSVTLLLRLTRERDIAVADEAQAGPDLIFKTYAGVTGVVNKLKRRAEELASSPDSDRWTGRTSGSSSSRARACSAASFSDRAGAARRFIRSPKRARDASASPCGGCVGPRTPCSSPITS